MDRTLAKALRAKTGGARHIATAVSLAVLLCTVLLAAPAAATRRRMPDLIVTSAKWTGKPYFFWKEPQGPGSFTDTTKNIGSRTAGHSETALFLTGSRNACSLFGELVGRRKVPKLKPGQANRGSFQSGEKLRFRNIGTYYVAAHADFINQVENEVKAGNNCKPTGQHVDVIPRRFAGTVTGSSSWSSSVWLKDTWTATVSFVAAYAHGDPSIDGVYIYALERADVTYTTSGTDPDNGCTYSGGTTDTLIGNAGGNALLTLDYRSNIYQLLGVIPSSAYSVTVVCPTPPSTSQLPGPNPSAWLWLSSDQTNWPSIDSSPGRTGTFYRFLDGSSDCTISGCDTKWKWRLDAK